MKSRIILFAVLAILVLGGFLVFAKFRDSQQSGDTFAPEPPNPKKTLVQNVVLLSTTSTTASAKPAIVDSPAAAPAFLLVGVPTTVTITLPITNASVISTGINLLQINSTGTQPIILGQLHDDGKNGDIAANDQIYSIRLVLTATGSESMDFQVSAAFRGVLARSLSPVLTLGVYSAPPPLPPDPGAVGTATLLGIDSDQDGIRDDVERYIALNYPASARMRAGLTQLAAAELGMIQDAADPSLSRVHVLQELYAIDCLDASPSLLNALRAQVTNTPERAQAYFQAVSQVPQLFFGSVPNPTSRCLIDPNNLPN